jgi:hypothetical protein
VVGAGALGGAGTDEVVEASTGFATTLGAVGGAVRQLVHGTVALSALARDGAGHPRVGTSTVARFASVVVVVGPDGEVALHGLARDLHGAFLDVRRAVVQVVVTAAETALGLVRALGRPVSALATDVAGVFDSDSHRCKENVVLLEERAFEAVLGDGRLDARVADDVFISLCACG